LPADCLALIQRSSVQDASVFFLYECPKLFRDPIGYLEALLSLRDNHPDMWRVFAASPGLVEAFFELHAPFLMSPCRASTWKHRLHLADVLFSLLPPSVKSGSYVFGFIDCCIRLIGHATFAVAAIFLRYVIRLMVCVHSKDELHPRAAHLLRILDSRDWSLLPLGLHFLLSLKPSVVSHSHDRGEGHPFADRYRDRHEIG
jgi:hypothetical protein